MTMETVIRNVGEIDAHDRQALEHVLGQSLRENQQLVIRIVNLQPAAEIATAPVPHEANAKPTLPEWRNVFEGLSDEDIADIMIAATALDHTRTLVTGNTTHFAWVPGLTLGNWRDS